MTNTRKDMTEIRKDRSRTTLTLNRNTDKRTYNKNYKPLFGRKVKRKVVVIDNGHSVIETPSICRDDRRYSGPLRSILKNSAPLLIETNTPTAILTSYTDTNVTIEPPHETNDDADINDSYDTPTAYHQSSKCDTPPPDESYPNYQQARSILTKRINTTLPGYQRIYITNRSIETTIEPTVNTTPYDTNQPETTPIPPPMTPPLHDVPPSSQEKGLHSDIQRQPNAARGQLGVSKDMLASIVLRKTSRSDNH